MSVERREREGECSFRREEGGLAMNTREEEWLRGCLCIALSPAQGSQVPNPHDLQGAARQGQEPSGCWGGQGLTTPARSPQPRAALRGTRDEPGLETLR